MPNDAMRMVLPLGLALTACSRGPEAVVGCEPVAEPVVCTFTNSIPSVTDLVGCNVVEGVVWLDGYGGSLAGLSGLEEVRGSLHLENVGSFEGLERLRSVQMELRLAGTGIPGLEPLGCLQSVGSLELEGLTAPDLEGLRDVSVGSGRVTILDTELTTLDGFVFPEEVSNLTLLGNGNLTDLQALSTLRRVSQLAVVSDVHGLELDSALGVRIEGPVTLSVAETTSLDVIGVASGEVVVDVGSVEGVTVSQNPGMTAASIGVDAALEMWIDRNEALTSLALPDLATTDWLRVADNDSLVTFGPFPQLDHVGTLELSSNAALTTLDAQNASSFDSVYVHDNPNLCQSEVESWLQGRHVLYESDSSDNDDGC